MISIGQRATFAGRNWRHWTLASLAATLVVLLAVAAAAAGPAPDLAGNASRMMAPLLGDDSGLIGAITRWIDESAATVASRFKDARTSIDDVAGRANTAAKDAATAVAGLPGANIVTGRERCATAPNGAPDCSGAIAALCRTKGLEAGHSLDIAATRKCPAEVLLSGRLPAPSECPAESFVTRAICK